MIYHLTGGEIVLSFVGMCKMQCTQCEFYFENIFFLIYFLVGEGVN